MEKQISSQTYELSKMLGKIAECKLTCEVLMLDKTIAGRTKHWLQRSIANRLNAIITDIKAALPHNDAKILANDILSDDVALGLSNVTNLYLSLDKEKRDKIEDILNDIQNV